MTRLSISYSLTRRPSQSRQAAAYMDILGEDHDLVNTQDHADIVVVHHPPKNYETVYALHPALRGRYVISCCVPHAEGIPAGWKRNLPRVQEVWTPSEFARAALAPHHPNVQVVPYAIERDTAVSPEAFACAQRLVAHDPGLVYFLAIGPLDEPRKNIPFLVQVFRRVCGAMPRARLIIKGAPVDQPTWPAHPQVIFLPMQMPFDYVSALYHLAHVYVSAHHAEAWGLAISDALLFGKPVIATGYSGSLEYLAPDSAYLLGWRPGSVPVQPRPGSNVEPGMVWADPDPHHLADLLLHLYRTHDTPEAVEKAQQAQAGVQHFNRLRAALAIKQRLNEITQAIGR